MPCNIGRCQLLKEVGSVIKCIGREAGVQMLRAFKVAAPTANGDVARAYDQMGVVQRGERHQLGMKATSFYRHRLDLVAAASMARPVF